MTPTQSRHKRPTVFGALIVIILLGVSPGVTTAWAQSSKATPRGVSKNAPGELKKILATCKTPKHSTACERNLWAFADVTGDGVLTSAEISRLLRLTSAAEGWLQAAKDPGQEFIVWTLVGPIVGNLAIANFDFDGDGKVSQPELHMNLGEGQAQQVLGDITAAGKALISTAMLQFAASSLPGVLGPGVLGPPGITMGVEPSQPEPRSTPTPSMPANKTESNAAIKTFTAADRQSLVQQIRRCWRLPAGMTADDVQDYSVALQLSIGRNGTPSAAKLADLRRLKADARYRAFADSALTAALDPICHPFNLPREKFDAWRRLTIIFKPNVARFD